MSNLFRDAELQVLLRQPPPPLLQLLLDVRDQNGKQTTTAMTSTTIPNATMMVETAVVLMSTQLIVMIANVLILILQQLPFLPQRSILSVKMTHPGAAIVHIGFQLDIALIKTLSLS